MAWAGAILESFLQVAPSTASRPRHLKRRYSDWPWHCTRPDCLHVLPWPPPVFYLQEIPIPPHTPLPGPDALVGGQLALRLCPFSRTLKKSRS